jgi:hypothetical protein
MSENRIELYTPEYERMIDHVLEIFEQAAKEAGVDLSEFKFRAQLEDGVVTLLIFKKGTVKHYHVKIAEELYSPTMEKWLWYVTFLDDDTLRAQAREASRLMRGEEWELEDAVKYNIQECYDWWCLPPGVIDS